jgi:hypothetical protein
MNEIQLRDLLFEMFPPEADGDWDDVLRRAKGSSPSIRRLTLLVAVALLAVLAVGSALALSGRLSGLLHGTPVNDLTPRERFVLSEINMNGKVSLIATRGSDAFYVIRQPDGRLCYSIGDTRKGRTPFQRETRIRFGSIGCPDGRVFPSRAVPVLDYSAYMLRPGDGSASLTALRGFASDPVARIGVIGRDNRIVYSVPVSQNVYTSGKKRIAGARGIVALGKDGKPLWVQCTARRPPGFNRSRGCGKYKTSPPVVLPPVAHPRKPVKPPGPVVVQRGSADGVSVVVRGAEITANFGGLSPEKHRLLATRGRITLGCFKLVTVGGKPYTSGAGVSKPFTTVLHVRPFSPDSAQRAPFDGCSATGSYGHTWNDANGTHDTVEIPLTPRGNHYFAERAAARDLAWLARARVFKDIRYAKEPLSAESAARRLGGHVVPLATPNATPPTGKLGIWLGDPKRIVLAERAPTGRRLYLEIRHGVIYQTNLIGLASII